MSLRVPCISHQRLLPMLAPFIKALFQNPSVAMDIADHLVYSIILRIDFYPV